MQADARNSSLASTRDDITDAYIRLLGREPESESVIVEHLETSSYKDVVRNITNSPEYTSRITRSPFYHYNASIDAEAIIRRHANPDVRPSAGFLTNYLGVLIQPRFLPQGLKGTEGHLEGIPIPANWHADIAEWAAALRAVDLAHKNFRMLELGCGWGCWMLNTGAAARRQGLSVELIGIDGDEGHVDFALEASRINGFRDDQVKVWRGVAAASDGIALFPRQLVAGESYGLKPIFGASESTRLDAVKSGNFDELEMIGLARLIGEQQKLDLLHIDIQGGEADLIDSCRSILRSNVAYVVVGTHSRAIEGRIFETMLSEGWRLEIERPAILSLDTNEVVLEVDGIQGWRNMALRPDK